MTVFFWALAGFTTFALTMVIYLMMTYHKYKRFNFPKTLYIIIIIGHLLFAYPPIRWSLLTLDCLFLLFAAIWKNKFAHNKSEHIIDYQEKIKQGLAAAQEKLRNIPENPFEVKAVEELRTQIESETTMVAELLTSYLNSGSLTQTEIVIDEKIDYAMVAIKPTSDKERELIEEMQIYRERFKQIADDLCHAAIGTPITYDKIGFARKLRIKKKKQSKK